MRIIVSSKNKGGNYFMPFKRSNRGEMPDVIKPGFGRIEAIGDVPKNVGLVQRRISHDSPPAYERWWQSRSNWEERAKGKGGSDRGNDCPRNEWGLDA
jgi:hypothetical protein